MKDGHMEWNAAASCDGYELLMMVWMVRRVEKSEGKNHEPGVEDNWEQDVPSGSDSKGNYDTP